ncbi:hypothetical protein EGW03_05350 [bacterium]|nr:hypothetical protein [bacterium]
MVSRMDKYHSESIPANQSRFQKNEHLYESLYNNKVVTEFSEINNNVLDLTSGTSSSSNRRENYQKNKASFPNYRADVVEEKVAFPNSIDKIIEDPSEKNYNINDILSEARKNRSLTSNDEKKRLKTVEYSILSDLSKEKLAEYRENKKKMSKDEEENLEELIHTITSNSLRKKIDDELLSDLLPTEEDETIISKELLASIEDTEDISLEKNNANEDSDKENSDKEDSDKEDFLKDTTNEMEIDRSFYTKSMDLSKEDFEIDDDDSDDDSFLEESKMSTTKKIFLVCFIVLVIAIVGYIVYRFI